MRDALAALERQVEAYERLAELAGEQARLVAQGDAERLLVVLQRRQGHMDRIAALEPVVAAEVKQDWPASVERWPPEDQERAAGALGRIKRLLEAITARDAQDVRALQQQRIAVQQQLKGAQSDDRLVRQINRRYAAAAYGEATAGRMDVRR